MAQELVSGKFVGVRPFGIQRPQEYFQQIEAEIKAILDDKYIDSFLASDQERERLRLVIDKYYHLRGIIKDRSTPAEIRKRLEKFHTVASETIKAMESLEYDDWELLKIAQGTNTPREFYKTGPGISINDTVELTLELMRDAAMEAISYLPKSTTKHKDFAANNFIKGLHSFYTKVLGRSYSPGTDNEKSKFTGEGYLFIKRCLHGVGLEISSDLALYSQIRKAVRGTD